MINVWGVVSIAVFYIIILVVGLWGSRRAANKAKKDGSANEAEMMIVAGRNMGFCLSLFSATATAVCGAYLTGTAEVLCLTTKYGGLLWCMTLLGALIGVMCGLMLAKPLRSGEFITMIEPFQRHYGKGVGVVFATISILAELIWTSSVLNALGATIVVVMDADNTIAIIVSSVIVIAYTLVGGLYAVAYTDVIQIIAVFCGLWACVPFALTNPHVQDFGFAATNRSTIANSTRGWLGELHTIDIGIYIDNVLLLLLGGMPWSSWIQRMLACKTPQQAKNVALLSGVSFTIIGLPCVALGAVAASTDWASTGYNKTLTGDDAILALPLVLQYLTPTATAFIGLGALSAAVMSSADSSILATGSLFAENIYKTVIRKKPSDKEVVWVMRGFMVLTGTLSTVLALMVRSVYMMYMASAEFAYILMFPQLFMVLHWKQYLNVWGCAAGMVTGVTLRILLGDLTWGLPPVIKLPLYDEETGLQHLPIKTISAIATASMLLFVSLVAEWIQTKTKCGGGGQNSRNRRQSDDERRKQLKYGDTNQTELDRFQIQDDSKVYI